MSDEKAPGLWDFVKVGLLVLAAIGLLALLFTGLWVFHAELNVYASRKSGEAELIKAEQTKKITIETAKAEVESAKLRAEAIKIVGEAAKQYPEYRHQEFIGAFGEALREGRINQVIYVPTEANIPILEARK